MWLQAPNIVSVHGFSTRSGGISQAPYNSLNLGGSDDVKENILQNRRLAMARLGLKHDSLCYLKQIHSADVCVAVAGQQQGDALVSNKPGDVLAVGIADCYPLLFEDPKNKVIGAAHAGWRGTLAGIAANTIEAMVELGAKKDNIKAAIGQGISQERFEVGNDVIEQFYKQGFPEQNWKENKIDLVKCNIFVMLKNGLKPENIWAMNRCTFEEDFFSHRRDKGNTGRMWGLIALNE